MRLKKKILVVSPGIPYPPIDGHKLKIYNLLRILSIDHEVDLVVITSEKLGSEAKDFLQQFCSTYKVFHYQKISFFFNLVRALFSVRLPFQVAYYTFRKVKIYLKKNANNYDYVFLNLIRTAGYFGAFNKNQLILDLVDSIGINYLRSRKNTQSIIYRTIYHIEASRLINFEKDMVSMAKLSLFVNKSEALYYSKYGMVKWLPNGVNEQLFELKFQNDLYKNCVCFFGAMFYQPNIDAALWFIKYVLPKLNKNIKFYIVGQKPSMKIIKAAETNKNIIVTGFIDNPYEILQSALCCVAPMQTGGGIQNKILESMALGQITITNNLGANPIDGSQSGENILVANSDDEFAKLINSLYENNQLFREVGENAKKFIKENYSWESYQKELSDALKNVVSV